MPIRKASWLLAAAALVLAGCSREPARIVVPEFDQARFHLHVRNLADDRFEGRAPATPGEALTIEYISKAFQEAGLEPGNGESYYQTVPMVEITAAPDAVLTVRKDRQTRRFKYADEMIVWTKRVEPKAELVDSDLVFVGYGIVAPEYGWNDYEGLDVKGKTVVVLINDPGYALEDPQMFNGKAVTYYGRWTYKFEEAARQGAAGALIIHETAPAAYGWEVVRSSWSGPQLDKWSEDGNAGRAAIEGWVTSETARSLFEMAGLKFEEMKQAALQKGFRAVPMNLKASVAVTNTIRRSESANVLGMIRGSERPDEYVVYMGHWDHLGRDPQREGDQIFNGAIDNATGISALILLAEQFAAARPKPKRSILFLATTGEESGLLGSAWYADNPIYPLERTAAVINIDALSEGGPTHDLSVIGYGNSELEELLKEAAARQGRRVEADPTPERGGFYRSDHFNFAKKGVPALYVKPGIDAVDGGVERGKAIHEDYVRNRYHQPSDEYREDMDFSGALQDLQLLYEVGYRVAREESWPNWYPGREFRAVRDASSAERERK